MAGALLTGCCCRPPACLVPVAFFVLPPESGFFYQVSSAIIAPIFYLVDPMIEEPSTLYAKLLGETAPIRWQELQPFFARGALLWVEGGQDLVAVAQAVAENDQARVAQWMNQGLLCKLEDSRAEDLLSRDPQLWAVVVAPWVLVQERAEDSTLH